MYLQQLYQDLLILAKRRCAALLRPLPSRTSGEREGNILRELQFGTREQKSTKESNLQGLTTLETSLPSLCEIHTYGFITSSTTPIDHQQQSYPDEIHQHRP